MSRERVEDALPVGTYVEEFRIVEFLGDGGFGITYKAYDEHLLGYVALKEFFPLDFAARRRDRHTLVARSSKTEDAFAEGLAAFKKEAQTLRRFNGHANIVHVSRYLEANGTAYMVMAYEEGQTLKEWLIAHGKAPDQETLMQLFLPILDGLRAVHQAQYLHRDVKPENIYIRVDGRPLLIDFGAARQAVGEKSRSLSVVLTEGFAPKEQYSSRGKQGAWTDIYALAASLYYALANFAHTGEYPAGAMDRTDALHYQEPDPLLPAVDKGKKRYEPHFLAAIDWALACFPEERPQTVREFQYALQGRDSSKPKPQLNLNPKPSPAPISPSPSPISESKPRLKLKWAMGLLVLGLSGYGAYAAYQQLQHLGQQQVGSVNSTDPTDSTTSTAVGSVERSVTDHEFTNVPDSTSDSEPTVIVTAPVVSKAEEQAEVDRKAQEAARAAYLARIEPEMVPIPAGRFEMGCVSGKGCQSDEKPVHTVSISAFEMGKYEVTNAQYAAFLQAKGRSNNAQKPWFATKAEYLRSQITENGGQFSVEQGYENHPVVMVSWYGATAYVDWLAEETGKAYRLPSEAEWEYAARAGTTTPYNTGECMDTDQANYDGNYAWENCPKTENYRGETLAVDAFSANAFGLYNVHGNVREWVQDCYHVDYKNSPDEVSAWEINCYKYDDGSVPAVLRGGSWDDGPRRLRSAYRFWNYRDWRFNTVGFRIARTR